MRALSKILSKPKNLLETIYLSDWFDPIYRIYRKPFQWYHTVEKFIYYGYYGTKCVDFDALSIHTLIHAHMVRVNDHMRSNHTHLDWNSNNNTGLMRKLAEFTELSRRMADNEFNDLYYFGKELDKIDSGDWLDRINKTSPEQRKKELTAHKKDDMIQKQHLDRYYYMLREFVPRFWD